MAQVADEQVVSIDKLGQQLRHLRLTSAKALRQMKRSLGNCSRPHFCRKGIDSGIG